MTSEYIPEIIKEKDSGTLEFGGARMAFLDIKEGFWGIRRQMEALIGDRLANSVLQQAGANGGASFARSFAEQSGLEKSTALAACIKAYQVAGFGKFEIIDLEWPLGRVWIQANNAFEAWMYQQKHIVVDKPVCAYSAGVFVGFVNILGERQDVVCIEHTCQAKGDETCLFELLPAGVAEGETIIPYIPDPGLGRQINLLEMLFERMPMGIAVLDLDYRLQRFNPTWVDFAERYAPPSAAPLVPGVFYFDHLPGTEPMVIPLFERALAGETVQQNSVRIESDRFVTYWDVVLAPLIENDEVVGILNVAVDATEREMLQQNLEKRVEERTRELRTLLQVSRDITSTLDLENLLNLILDQLIDVVDYSGASILILEEDYLAVQVYRGPIPREEAQRLKFPLKESLVNSEVLRQKKPLIISDILDETPLARLFQETASDQLETTFGYVRSWMGVPLMVKGTVLGMLTLDHNHPNHFLSQHADLVLAFANQAAVAIDNARLYQAEKEHFRESEHRRLVAESLRDIIQMINSDIPIDTFLDRAVVLAAQRLGASGCILHHFDLDKRIIIHQASYGFEGIFEKKVQRSFANLKTYGADTYVQATLQGQPTYANYPPLPERVEVIRHDATIPKELKESRIALRERFASSFSVPLFIQDQVYGGLVFYYSEPQEFTEERVQLGLTFANQLAVALENAQLLERAEEAAVTAERNRLARDLHDAVTQTLFSASMIADVLPKIWERKPEEGKRRLEELRQLTRGALSEMRTLLVELRPAALVDTDLEDLIGHQVNAFNARTRLPVTFESTCETNPPPEIKEMLYRIVQETFNNIAKHADALEVWVDLECHAGETTLQITDNGMGFDLDTAQREGLGLGIMAERARNVGAQFEIHSQIGRGTKLKIIWVEPSKEKDDV